MRKNIAAVGVVTSVLLSGAAFAQEPAAAPAPTAAVAPPAAEAEKKLSVGGDLQFVLPVGDFGDVSGPQIGPLLRVGYMVAPAIELTGRIGYLAGLEKDVGGSKFTISNIPIWVGGRYFFMQPGAGLYGAGEVGLNMLQSKFKATMFGQTVEDSDSATRFGFNVGAGYVISKELPIDIRAQFMHHNLLGTESGEKAMLGLGLSAGYTVSF